MTTVPTLPLPAGCCTDGIDAFFALVRASNPFVDNRVNGPMADGVDVEDIHLAEFERLAALAREARDLRRGVGAVLWGEAGVGKSHLLARLARWAEKDGQGCVIYLHNLQARPENLPRSLLRSVVSILTRGRVRGFGRTPLYELAFALVMEALDHDTAVKRVPWPEVERAYSKLIDSLSAADPSRAAVVDRTAYDVVYRFMRSVYRLAKTRDESGAALAVRWLSGDYLDPSEARQLGLPPGRGHDEPVALADDQQIKQVLVALSRMALSRGQPFVLCFDQVDNLGDDQAAALSRFLEALIDGAPNLFVVTAGVKASLLHWRQMKVFQDSAWDRLAQFEVFPQRLTPPESRRVVAARLERVVTPFVELEPVRLRLQHDDLFPLGRAWAEEFFRDKIELRPRDAINGAREGWRRAQERLRQLGGPAWLDDWDRTPAGNGHVPPDEPTEEDARNIARSGAGVPRPWLRTRTTLPAWWRPCSPTSAAWRSIGRRRDGRTGSSRTVLSRGRAGQGRGPRERQGSCFSPAVARSPRPPHCAGSREPRPLPSGCCSSPTNGVPLCSAPAAAAGGGRITKGFVSADRSAFGTSN